MIIILVLYVYLNCLKVLNHNWSLNFYLVRSSETTSEIPLNTYLYIFKYVFKGKDIVQIFNES